MSLLTSAATGLMGSQTASVSSPRASGWPHSRGPIPASWAEPTCFLTRGSTGGARTPSESRSADAFIRAFRKGLTRRRWASALQTDNLTMHGFSAVKRNDVRALVLPLALRSGDMVSGFEAPLSFGSASKLARLGCLYGLGARITRKPTLWIPVSDGPKGTRLDNTQ